MSQPTSVHALTIDEVRAAARRLTDYVVTTPVHRLCSHEVTAALGEHTEVWLKLELFQHTGTFKARGALLNVLNLSEHARRRGVIAVSAGNHAAGVAFAAATAGIHTEVVLFESGHYLCV